jgi:hypothetical protein
MRRLVVVLNGMSTSIASKEANTKKRHRNVPNGVKWDQTRQKLLVTNELCSVIRFGERIMRAFCAKMVKNWIERRRWRLHGLPGTESVNVGPLTYISRVQKRQNIGRIGFRSRIIRVFPTIVKSGFLFWGEKSIVRRFFVLQRQI